VCEEVARTKEGVLVTKRGKPFVRIVPLLQEESGGSEVWQARERYAGKLKKDEDFTLPDRNVEPLCNPFSEKER
jgi:antitoxin (DNA-binding transcriptional repressor) of toxin-antitoxin stability system